MLGSMVWVAKFLEMWGLVDKKSRHTHVHNIISILIRVVLENEGFVYIYIQGTKAGHIYMLL